MIPYPYRLKKVWILSSFCLKTNCQKKIQEFCQVYEYMKYMIQIKEYVLNDK